MAAEPPEHEQRRLKRRWIGQALAVLGVVVAGAVLMAVGDPGDTVYVVGFVVLGVALTVGAALVFYEIGRSEDRARAAGRH